jgi:hypothetical protein
MARKTRVERALVLRAKHVLHLVVEDDAGPHGLDSRDLASDDRPGESVRGDPEAHHAAGDRACVSDLHVVAEPSELVGRGEAARPRADDEDALAGRRAWREAPPLGERAVSQEALDRVDRDRGVQLGPVTSRLTRGGSRPCRGSRAAGCHGRGAERPPRTGPPARARATLGYLPPRGRPRCTVEAGPRTRPSRVERTHRVRVGEVRLAGEIASRGHRRRPPLQTVGPLHFEGFGL